jgi:hypothetical protein
MPDPALVSGDSKLNNMQNESVDIRRIRVSDYPELQVGFPERNDASDPYIEVERVHVEDMERIHVDFETMGISKKSASELARDMIRQGR